MRPLVLEYPDDPRTWGLDDEFMFGRDLLLAPVLQEAERVREVYLPKGEWFDFWTGRATTEAAASRPVTLGTIPIFVGAARSSSASRSCSTPARWPGQPLHVSVYPAAASTSTFYEDDGETLNTGRRFVTRRFTRPEPLISAAPISARR